MSVSLSDQPKGYPSGEIKKTLEGRKAKTSQAARRPVSSNRHFEALTYTAQVSHRLVRVGGRSLSTREGVPDSAGGLDEFVREVTIHLRTKGADIYVDYIGESFEAGVPYVLNDHGPRDRTICISHKILKEKELLWPKVNGLAEAGDSPANKIDFQVSGVKPIDGV
jgi:hypothetical protein